MCSQALEARADADIASIRARLANVSDSEALALYSKAWSELPAHVQPQVPAQLSERARKQLHHWLIDIRVDLFGFGR